jgi:hypothetical protein
LPPENVRCEGQAKAAALRSGLRSPGVEAAAATKKAEAAEAAAATPSEPMDVEELAAALRFDMAWSKEVKARCRAEAAGPHPKPRGRAPLGADGRRKCWDKDNGGWQDHVLVLPMLAAPPPPSPASHPQAPQLPQPLQPPSLPPSPPKEQQRSETFSETVLVTPSGSRGHKLKRTSPGGTTRCAQYTSPAGTVPQLLQCESRAAALADVGWNEFGTHEPRKVNRGFSWHEKEDSYKYGFKNSMDFQDFQPLYAAAASVW